MSCIAGTVEKPLRWVRFTAGEPVELEGRWCDRIQPFTNRVACSSCPAYRGTRYDGSEATGVAPSGDPIGLTVDEHERWQAAQDAALIEDDFSLLGAWQERMAGGPGERALRDIGDPDAAERWAGYIADWRKANPDRAKELNRAHARAYRARKRVSKLRQKPTTETV